VTSGFNEEKGSAWLHRSRRLGKKRRSRGQLMHDEARKYEIDLPSETDIH
jgi:hypothetical protein